MAGSKSDYLENKLLDRMLGGYAYTFPVTLYLALYTTAPTDAGGGVEVTGGSYARASIANNSGSFNPATNSVKVNANSIDFPTATADWGTVVAVGIFDDPTAGNLLYWATLNVAKPVLAGDIASFGPGGLTFTED